MNNIRNVYKKITQLENFLPEQKTDALFLQLNNFVFNPDNKNPFTKKEISNLHYINSRVTYHQECVFAKEIIKSKNPQKTFKNFFDFNIYQEMVDREWQALLSCSYHKNHTVLFIGGGPLPITAILLAQKYSRHVTVLDVNPKACALAGKVIKKLNLNNKIRIIASNAVQFKSYKNYNAIFVAAMAGIDLQEKEEIFSYLYVNTLPGTHILARNNIGLREIIEPKLPALIYQLFNPIYDTIPINSRTNSAVILKHLL